MDGVGWRGWALAFSAAILVHAGIVLFLVRQEPEPGIRPEVERVAAILLGRVDSTDGDPPAEFAESIDAEMVTEVEGAPEVPPGEAPPAPPKTASAASPEDAVTLDAVETDARSLPEAAISTPPAPATPASPEDAAMLAALQIDTRPPPEEALSMPPAPATPASPEGATVLDALPTDTRPPPEEALSMPPAPASPASPEDAVALDAVSNDVRSPPEEAISTPPAPATLASPTGATVLAALPTDTRPPPEAALSTPPAPATPAPPENAVALAEIEPAEPPAVEEAVAASPESTATLTPVPVPANTPTRDSVAEPVHFVGAESVDPARAAAASEPAEMVDSAETATPSVDSWELATEVSDIDEATDDSTLPEAVPTPPESAKIAPLENAEVLTVVEGAGLTPLVEAASTPPIEPVSADARASESVPEPARLVAAEGVDPTPSPAALEPVKIVASAETVAPSLDSLELAAEVRNIDETSDYSPLPEAVPTPLESAKVAPLENAEVLTAVEDVGLTPAEEVASTPLEPATTPSIEPAPVDARASESVPEPARLVAAESVDPTPSPAALEPVKIVASAETVAPSLDSQELAIAVPDIDEATTVSPLPAAISTLSGTTTSPPLEEAVVLTEIETAGSSRLEAAVSSPPLPAEIVGPTEEVQMRVVIDQMAFMPAPVRSEAQEAQQAPEADDETGASPGVADDESVSAGRAEYLARLQDRLFKRLTYPHVARAHRQTGTALLHVVVERTGRVQFYELRTSTGHELLDREIKAMVERARPFPPLPEEMREDRLKVLLNVEFVLE